MKDDNKSVGVCIYEKINLIHKIIILSLSALFVLPGCASNTEDYIDENIAIGGPVKYDSDGNHCIMNMVRNLKKSGKAKMET